MNVKSKSILEGVCGLLKENWAGKHSARVSVADNPGHAINLLTQGLGGVSAVVFYMSDTPTVSSFPGNTMLDATVRIGVVQKTSLEVRDGSGASPILDVVDDLRKYMAGVASKVEGLADPLEYKGMTPIQMADGRALDGYALSYLARYAFDV